jgi:hypothetical protein
MLMSFNSVLLGVVLGSVLGMGVLRYTSQTPIVQGRLSACNDIFSAVNAVVPAQIECRVYKGEVYITVGPNPTSMSTLDAKQILPVHEE